MKQFYYIKTCNTSTKILKQLPLQDFEIIDVKSIPITVQQLDILKTWLADTNTYLAKELRNIQR